MFEKAARLKIRFETSRGVLSVEDLWDLPLSALDNIYKSLRRISKAASEESLLDTVSAEAGIVELKAEIVKHIVQVKLAENVERENEAANKAKKEKILEILSRKQDASLENMSEEDLRKMVESL